MTDKVTRWSTVVDFRLAVVCVMAIAISMPMAIVSLAKVLLFVYGAVYLISRAFNPLTLAQVPTPWTTRAVLSILCAFAASLLWTDADQGVGVTAFLKHAKLMEVVLIICLVRSAGEARMATGFFISGQVFVLVSSWLMAANIPLFWSNGPSGQTGTDWQFVPFASSYLDQSLMLALSAMVAWHQPMGSLWARRSAIIFSVAAFLNVLLLMRGRTGYIVIITAAWMAAFWQTPRRLRIWTITAAPLLVIAILFLLPIPFHDRMVGAVTELNHYQQQPETHSSIGARLNMWHRSIQAITDHALTGYGVGSWSGVAKHAHGGDGAIVFGEGNISNPHQEYLLWGVELGILGVFLLPAFMVAAVQDARQFSTANWRSTLSVIIALVLTSLLNSPLYDDLLGDYFCVTLGLLMALGFREHESSLLSIDDCSNPCPRKHSL